MRRCSASAWLSRHTLPTMSSSAAYTRHGSNGDRPGCTAEQAQAFLQDLSRATADQPHVLSEFRNILFSFKNGANVPAVVDSAVMLLRATSHRRFLERLNIFLPPGYSIICSPSAITVTTPTGVRTY
ncbi:hypothetical protein BKA62DRAFT_691532 [Auriculariales sp. MPI-PUGE-AT-0066]|nr:hypothetical protein BKA62DRAFT_691532 [Auriculariales sp. MPI-PUGE-AT-0066]